MAETGGLTRRQSRFLAALFEYATVGDAALAAGISERSASRYLADSAVQSELLERQGAMLAAAALRLVSGMPGAADTLIAIHSDGAIAPAVRVSAARGILGDGLRLAELYSLEQRVADLETHIIAIGGINPDVDI